eukprot:15376914-Alexandrium_andersonii.AAC.1
MPALCSIWCGAAPPLRSGAVCFLRPPRGEGGDVSSALPPERREGLRSLGAGFSPLPPPPTNRDSRPHASHAHAHASHAHASHAHASRAGRYACDSGLAALAEATP